jgi:hypothetical protein
MWLTSGRVIRASNRGVNGTEPERRRSRMGRAGPNCEFWQPRPPCTLEPRARGTRGIFSGSFIRDRSSADTCRSGADVGERSAGLAGRGGDARRRACPLRARRHRALPAHRNHLLAAVQQRVRLECDAPLRAHLVSCRDLRMARIQPRYRVDVRRPAKQARGNPRPVPLQPVTP